MAKVHEFVVESDYRENAEGLDQLALSIESDGLYQPIIVKPYSGEDENKKYEIVAGRRRFRALTQYLHWESLRKNDHFIVKEGIDALVAQFQENFNRQDFTPIEIGRLIKAIHERQVAQKGAAIRGQTGGWGLKDTGQMIGRDSAFVQRMITIANNEEEVKDCGSVKQALETIEKKKTKGIRDKIQKAKYEKYQNEIPQTIDNLINNVVNEGAVNYLKSLDENSCDLVLVDPPYAINYDKMVTGDSYASYEDDPEKVKLLLLQCFPQYYRVLKDDKYCIVFTAVEWLSWVKENMIEAGFRVASTPIFWIKLNSTGKSMNPAKTLGSQVEVAVYGWKGDAELSKKGSGNAFPFPIVRQDRIHVAQKPDALLESIIKVFSFPGDTVLDTFCGSLSTLRGCFLANRNFMGCEELEDTLTSAINYTREWAKKRSENESNPTHSE